MLSSIPVSTHKMPVVPPPPVVTTKCLQTLSSGLWLKTIVLEKLFREQQLRNCSANWGGWWWVGTSEASEERGRRGMHVYPAPTVPFWRGSHLTMPRTDELEAWGQKEHVSLRRILWSSPRLSDPSTHVLSTKNPGPPPTVARKGQRCWVAATQWWLPVPRRGHRLLWAQSQYPRSSGRTGCRQGYKVGWHWPSQLWVAGCPLGLDVACGGLLPA